MSERFDACYADFKDSIGNPHGGSNKILSSRRGKEVSLRETKEGGKYVLRRYSPRAIQDIAGRQGAFVRKLAETTAAFNSKGIQVVEHKLIQDEEARSFPIAVVADYIEDLVNLKDAKTATKRRVAAALGNLATDPDNENDVFIGSDMIMPDMFHVGTGSDGEETITLIDIDPRVIEIGYKPDSLRRSMMAAAVLRTAHVMWDDWVNEDERASVFPGLTIEAGRGLDPNCDLSDELFLAVSRVNLMDNGVDYRSRSFAAS